jgi:hypothetical protein
LEGLDGTNAQFTPNFPGTYKLNYTIVDGCNTPKVYQVTITARCITQAKMPVVPNAVTNFYCAGDPQSTAVNVAGAFQKVDLWSLSHKQINIVEGSTFDSPTAQDITGVCYVAPTVYTCSSLRTYFNGLDFGDFISSSSIVGDKFKQCCNCLYSLTIINGGSSNNPTPSPTPSTTPAQTPSGTTAPGTTPSNNNNNSGKNSALTAEEAKRKRNENILIGLAAPLGVILIASMALNAYMVLKLRQGGPSKGGFNVEAGDVELSTSPSRHMDV